MSYLHLHELPQCCSSAEIGGFSGWSVERLIEAIHEGIQQEWKGKKFAFDRVDGYKEIIAHTCKQPQAVTALETLGFEVVHKYYGNTLENPDDSDEFEETLTWITTPQTILKNFEKWKKSK